MVMTDRELQIYEGILLSFCSLQVLQEQEQNVKRLLMTVRKKRHPILGFMFKEASVTSIFFEYLKGFSP